MANTIAPPVYVAPPGVEPQRFGLLSVAQTVDEAGQRWELGLEWEPLACTRAGVASIVCDTFDEYDAPGYPLDPREGEGLTESSPFLVIGSYSCKSASRSIEEAEERARAHLSAGEERAVEYAIATGAGGNEPSFQGATDLTPTAGTAVSVTDGVGLLEAHLAENHHSVGTIHAPRLLASTIAYTAAAERHGQRLETLAGTFVVVGGGYDLANLGPGGAAPDAGTAWLFATGRPQLRRGQVFVNDEQSAFDKGTNDVTFYAQRTYSVAWDCVTAAVLVDAPGG